MSSKNALFRYRILDEYLSDRHHFYTRQTLTKKVNEALRRNDYGYSYDEQKYTSPGVCKRVIEMDLKNMEKIFDGLEYEEEIYCFEDKGPRKTIRYKDPTFSIFKKALSNEEQRLLREVLNTLDQFSGLDNFQWLQELKTKLDEKNAFGGTTLGTNHQDNKIISFSSNEYLTNKEYLGWFFTAITNRKVVKIKYLKFNAPKEQEIKLYPYMLKQYNNRWYLLGTPISDEKQSYDPDFIANYPLDRIMDKEYYEGTEYVDCSRDIEELYEDIYGVTYPWNKPVEEIIFATHKNYTPYLRTKPLHPNQCEYPSQEQEELRTKYPHLADYDFFHVDLKLNIELKSFFRSLGSSCVVLSPEELRKDLFDDLKSQIKLYSD